MFKKMPSPGKKLNGVESAYLPGEVLLIKNSVAASLAKAYVKLET